MIRYFFGGNLVFTSESNSLQLPLLNAWVKSLSIKAAEAASRSR